MKTLSSARIGMYFAIGSAVTLLVMFAVGSRITGEMNLLGQAGSPDAFSRALAPAATGLITLLAVDNLFLLAYTGTFISGTALFWKNAKLFGMLTLFFSALLALLDLGENALIIHMARSAVEGVALSAGQIDALAVIEQVKYGSGTLALAFIGAGMLAGGPVQSPRRNAMAAAFFLFGPVNALKVVLPNTSLFLVFWMLLMLIAAGLYFQEAARAGH